MNDKVLFTIGYERQAQAAVIAKLQAAGVDLLIDVRAVAASRRAGFSKRVLEASLSEAGIGYLHLRQLGTPKPGRDAARKGRIAEMTAIFEDHLQDEGAQHELAVATAKVRDHSAALMCFEADHAGCHRNILADLICTALPCSVEHL